MTDTDVQDARGESWWGGFVPSAPVADLSGHWARRWKGLGLLDSLRLGEGTLPGAEGPVVIVLVRER